jgi:hypothetical protein
LFLLRVYKQVPNHSEKIGKHWMLMMVSSI